MRLNCGYCADISVDQIVIVELKSVERILPAHEAQTMTHLQLSGCKVGMLMNFTLSC
jgi:GxxExxY protein